MERWRDRIAVVTGASSGIGAAVVKDLVKAGLIAVALARRQTRMEQQRAESPKDLQSRLHIVKCDVADLQSVNAAFDWIEEQLGGVDVLVNNAGTFVQGQLLTLDAARLQQVLQVNFMGVVYCTQRAFQSMRARNFDGHIIVMNSVTGHQIFSPPANAINDLNIYPCTKHALTAFVELVRQELRGFQTKIKITNISPGFVDTEIVPEHYKSECMLHARDIAEGVLYALATPPHVQVHELTIKPVGEAI